MTILKSIFTKKILIKLFQTVDVLKVERKRLSLLNRQVITVIKTLAQREIAFLNISLIIKNFALILNNFLILKAQKLFIFIHTVEQVVNLKFFCIWGFKKFFFQNR